MLNVSSLPVLAPALPRSRRPPLLRWYRQNARDLPWRRTRDPYAILVSEFMLQQTQVATVLPYYERWLRRFPDFAALARAAERDVLHAWQGLGYYSRARNLHAAAKTVVRDHGGKIPEALETIRALPGVGRYTAGAVATFAFDQPVPIIDANIARVLARLANLREPIDAAPGREALWQLASGLVPKTGAGLFNSALMELGALLCLPRNPKCPLCPVRKSCRGIDVELLPIKKAKSRTVWLTENHRFSVQEGKLLLEQSSKRWRGLWILPPLAKIPAGAMPLISRSFPFTNHKITLAVFAAPPPRRLGPTQAWFVFDALHSIPIPSPHRRAIEKLVENQT